MQKSRSENKFMTKVPNKKCDGDSFEKVFGVSIEPVSQSYYKNLSACLKYS